MDAISQLLLVLSGSVHGKRQFYFLGCCREEGMLEEHPFGRMISGLSLFRVCITIVKLTGMCKEMTNAVVSNLLHLFPRQTRPLSELIHHKTKGNLLFFSRLMISLCKDDLLRLSLSRRRWTWDEEKIQSRNLPDDVVIFLTSTIGKLPKEVQDALRTLSCFGGSSNCSLIETLEAQLGHPLTAPLDLAVTESILNKRDGYYFFCHDRLREAAYNMIPTEEKCLFHFQYGVALVPHALKIEDDDLLYKATSQINLGGVAAVEDAEQAILIASLNLTAGKKAMKMSDFPSSFQYVDHGISFLPKQHWKQHYELSLDLFENASKCALVIGDFVSLELLSAQIHMFAQSFEDTLNSVYNVVSALDSASSS